MTHLNYSFLIPSWLSTAVYWIGKFLKINFTIKEGKYVSIVGRVHCRRITAMWEKNKLIKQSKLCIVSIKDH